MHIRVARSYVDKYHKLFFLQLYSSSLFSDRFAYLNAVKSPRVNVLKFGYSFLYVRLNGTGWMVGFLLFYKLCERGESVFPIYLG